MRAATDSLPLPPGPRLPAPVLTAIWARRAQWVMARRLRAPAQIAGCHLPAGVTVTPSIYLLHRRPDVYPDPEAFRPERFLESPPGTYTWIPFGGGVRRCIGAAFAQFEMRVVLAELVRRRRMRPARAPGEPVLRRAITETPRYDAEVVLSPSWSRGRASPKRCSPSSGIGSQDAA